VIVTGTTIGISIVYVSILRYFYKNPIFKDKKQNIIEIIN